MKKLLSGMRRLAAALSNSRKRRLAIALLAAVSAAGFYYIAHYHRNSVFANAPLLPPSVGFYAPPSDNSQLENFGGARPKNVILLIGDGMGPGVTYMASIQSGNPNGRLHMERMPVIGTVRTHCADSTGTDSAAAATAMATGHKTRMRMLGVLPDGKPVANLVEAARAAGLRTGVVTTDDLTGATPSGFLVHDGDRGNAEDIARKMSDAPPDVLYGFHPKEWQANHRADHADLIGAMRGKGFAVATDAESLRQAQGGRVLGLFDAGLLALSRPPTLPHMTRDALDRLNARDGSEEGFFLMVEGGLIDKYGHKNNFNGMLEETLWFDMAVAEAQAFAARNPDTLIVVTADHDTGGVSFWQKRRDDALEIDWGTGGHTATPVQLFAIGPGSEKFAGVIDNTDIAKNVAGLLGLKLTE